MNEILDIIKSLGVIPVVELQNVSDAPALGKALLNGGLPLVEMTFRTEAAVEAIRCLNDRFPSMIIGAGTIISQSQAELAVKVGAKFIVSPGIDIDLVEWCQEQKVLAIPGVVTPSEIMLAMRRNLNILKFFPAEVAGGVNALKALSAPFRTVKFIPTGGITQNNLLNYLSLSAVIACGGSWMVSKSLIKQGKFKEITRLVEEALEIVKQIRSQGDTS